MRKFIFAYLGSSVPETEEEQHKVMAAWQAWIASHGTACVDQGAPVGISSMVSAEGVVDDGGTNALAGYSVVEAESRDAAIDIAMGCPIINDGGSVEVADIYEM